MAHRVGIIGLESMGQIYARLATRLGLDVIGADIRPDVRQDFESEFEAETRRDFQDLYAEGIDAVVIATPNKFHESTVIPALERDIHVFLEKPLAHDVASASTIVDVANSRDLAFRVGYYHRYMNVVRCLKAYLDDGYFGEVTNIEATYTMRRGIPNRGSWYTSEDIAGGGVLVDKGTFVIDLLGYFFDDPPIETVAASTSTVFGESEGYVYLSQTGTYGHAFDEEPDTNIFDVEDTAAVFMELESGIAITMNVSWAENQPGRHEYRIKGSEGGAYLDITTETNPALTFYDAGSEGTDHLIDRQVGATDNNPRREQFERFVEAIRDPEKRSEENLEHALYVQRVVDDIYSTVV